MSSSFFVYLLQCDDYSTYVGATVNLERRLRQHNKEIKGGATITSIKVSKGYKWKRVCHVSGFPDWKSALQFEWRWKQLTRKIKLKMFPLEKRMTALQTLLSLDRPTTKSVPYIEWVAEPIINKEIESEYFTILSGFQVLPYKTEYTLLENKGSSILSS
jgi:structure-specific endonuclease subunit SLX1